MLALIYSLPTKALEQHGTMALSNTSFDGQRRLHGNG